MHNNYFFIKKLVPFLHRINVNGTITECFSQEKDELIIKIEKKDELFYIKASLKPHSTFLSYPDSFARARNNSVDLFQEIIGEQILAITPYDNERAFSIQLTHNKMLFFKIWGNHGNIIYFVDQKFVRSFNQKLIADEEIIPQLANKDFLLSEDSFNRAMGDLTKVVPTLGKIATEYWNKHIEDQSFEALLNFVNTIDQSHEYYIVKHQKNIYLTLFKIGEVIHKTYNPVEASNLMYHTHTSIFQLVKEKNEFINLLQSQIKKTEKYIQKSGERLHFLENEARNEEFGHIIMANLHNIPPKSTEIELDDFYNEGKTIKIPLKKDLNPQQNAENFYKKAKNEWREKANIKDNISARENKIIELQLLLEKVANIFHLKELRQLSKTSTKKKNQEPSIEELFRKINIDNYTVLIGKNSANNELLTLKYATKEDIWLHARNSSGSHVVIKNIPGQKTPKAVIERAAEIAAYHSKSKNDTLTPVMYTPKKFVRKIKGSAPGSVVVDKEEVIMVQPKDYTNS